MRLAARETTAIRLEASTVCQLACPSCPTTHGVIKQQIGAGFLRFEQFRRIVDENPWVHAIELSNWGEIFLNPDIGAIIAYAHRRSVALTASNGANLNHVKDDVLEALARYKFRGITCSIDGVTEATYAAYRVKGDLERVLGNIRKINAYKARWKTRYPLLRWQMIAFGHNAHEVEAARVLARELGMAFFLKADWDASYSPVPDEAEASAAAASPGVPSEPVGPPRGRDASLSYCLQLWKEPQVNFDGALLGCCVNTWGTFGPNASEVGLERALADEKLAYAKQMLGGSAPPRDDIPCVGCGIYRRIIDSGEWLRPPVEPGGVVGVAGFLKRHGLGRVTVWLGNRFEPQIRSIVQMLDRLRREPGRTLPAIERRAPLRY